jgi:hypothetical protein
MHRLNAIKYFTVYVIPVTYTCNYNPIPKLVIKSIAM